METTKITVSFRDAGATQLPYMMIIREYYVDGKIVYAEVIAKAEETSDLKAEYSFDEMSTSNAQRSASRKQERKSTVAN